MEPLGHFLQNDTTKFVEILPAVVILRSFYVKTQIFEGAYLQNYNSDFDKIQNLCFFTQTPPANQILSKTEKVELRPLGDLRWNDQIPEFPHPK